MNTVAAVLVGALVVGAFVMLAIAEHDRHRRAHRFGVGLRRSHLHGDVRRPWRWALYPVFTPEVIGAAIGGQRVPPLSGRARTYLGALHAGCRARRHLERELENDRRRFLGVVNDPDHGLKAVFGPSVSAGNDERA